MGTQTHTRFSPFTASGMNRVWSCVKISCVGFPLVWRTVLPVKEEEDPRVLRETTASYHPSPLCVRGDLETHSEIASSVTMRHVRSLVYF